ncbi:hypothetical protein pb186bvf_003448 [Paramecium bursaria]
MYLCPQHKQSEYQKQINMVNNENQLVLLYFQFNLKHKQWGYNKATQVTLQIFNISPQK